MISHNSIGILSIVVLKLIVFSVVTPRFYRGFYRNRPFAANIMMLMLDWANFALSIGFVVARIVKLMVAAFLFVGKIDTPLLVPGVSFLDKIPEIFLKDILLHEAHRHPYIEQLGIIYLMKLRYSNDFGKQAGSNWRLLFVYALMPWMSKYRIQLGDDADDAVGANVLALERALSRKLIIDSESSEVPEQEIVDEADLLEPAEEQNVIICSV